MKKKRISRFVWLVIIASILGALLSFAGCNQKAEQEGTEQEGKETIIINADDVSDADDVNTTIRFHRMTPFSEQNKKGDLEVMEIEGCTYIFWHNSYGSDFEHHAGCKNPIHWNQRGFTAPNGNQ